MKKSLLLLILLFLIPMGVSALEPNYRIDGFYVEADVKENGDMLVKEQILMKGSFNGYVRDLYRGSIALTSASDIELQRICEVNPSIPGDFDLDIDTVDCFSEQLYAEKGDSYVYTLNQISNGISLTMYNYTPSGSKYFYIEYLLKDVVVLHNDVAELYWKFIGSEFSDDIAAVKITINLPDKASDLRVWAHGPVNGEIDKYDGNKIVLKVDDLYANTFVEARATFDKDIIPYGTKNSGVDSLSSILDEEQKWADEANAQRKIAIVLKTASLIISGLWIFGAIALAIYTYKKYDKERKSTFNLEYHREFPAEYGPEIVEYLMDKNITTKSLSAMILNIIYKKGFTIREELGKHSKKEYILIKKDIAEDKLTAEEAYVVDWLINEIGDGKEVSLKDIKAESESLSSAEKFVKKYDKWHSIVKTNAVSENFYENYTSYKIKAALYAFLGFTATFFLVESVLVYMMYPVSILLFAYIIIFTRRTVKGNDHFVKWKAFKKFLLDFGRFKEKELPEIVLWEKYLVYATALGVADKVSKTMEIKIKELGVDPNIPIYHSIYFNHYFASNLGSTISTARNMSVSKIASSRMSSGSGGGGGFSSGGGGGGGGGGGHGF